VSNGNTDCKQYSGIEQRRVVPFCLLVLALNRPACRFHPCDVARQGGYTSMYSSSGVVILRRKVFVEKMTSAGLRMSLCSEYTIGFASKWI